MKKIQMHKAREILRLRHNLNLTYRDIRNSCSCSIGTVANILKRAHRAGITWPLNKLSNKELDLLLYPAEFSSPKNRSPYNYEHNTQVTSISQGTDYFNFICGYKEDEIILIDYNDIFYLETSNRKVHIHTKHGVYYGNKSLDFYENKLNSLAFFRCHKSYIVNLGKIHKFSPSINYTYDMYFKECKEVVPLSRGKVKELKSLLGLSLEIPTALI